LQGATAVPANSLYFGAVLAVQGTNTIAVDAPKSDAYLRISAQSDGANDGTVEIYDPIRVYQVDQSNGLGSGAFQMDVLGWASNSRGLFIWGGDNVFEAGNPADPGNLISNKVNLLSGSRTRLEPNMTLNAPAHVWYEANSAYLEITGWLDPAVHAKNILTLDDADFDGQIHFNLNDEFHNDYSRVTPFTTADYEPLLEINLTTGKTVSIANAIVTASIGDMVVPMIGDEYILIDTGVVGGIEAAGVEYATASNPLVTVRRNNLTNYVFTGDTKVDVMQLGGVYDYTSDANTPNGQAAKNRFYVLHYIGHDIAPPAVVVTHAYAAGTAHAAMIGTWLPDHSYQQADLNIRQEDSWAMFGGVDGSRFSVIEDSRVDLAGVTALIGVARKSTHDAGTFLFGGFIEGAFFKYDVDGIDIPGDLTVGGKGDTRSLGVGLMARETFNNKLRIEATARVGRLYNEFNADDYFVNNLHYRHDYDIETTYYGFHLGLGYTKVLNDVSSLDFILRGYWTRVEGTHTVFDEGETIYFDDTDSKRLRGGVRYTRQTSENVYWYAGGYYDYEFDHKIHATTEGLVIGAPRLSGGTGIFEIGLETHPSKNNENFSFAFGFQGYVGAIRGISGGIRLGYEF
jgi:hypothetical protein